MGFRSTLGKSGETEIRKPWAITERIKGSWLLTAMLEEKGKDDRPQGREEIQRIVRGIWGRGGGGGRRRKNGGCRDRKIYREWLNGRGTTGAANHVRKRNVSPEEPDRRKGA